MLLNNIKNKFFTKEKFFILLFILFYFFIFFSFCFSEDGKFNFSSYREFILFLKDYAFNREVDDLNAHFPKYSTFVRFEDADNELEILLKKKFKYTKEHKFNTYEEWTESIYYNKFLKAFKHGGCVVSTLPYNEELKEFNTFDFKSQLNLIYKNEKQEIIRLQIPLNFSTNYLSEIEFSTLKNFLNKESLDSTDFDKLFFLKKFDNHFLINSLELSEGDFLDEFVFNCNVSFWFSNYNRFIIYNNETWDNFLKTFDSCLPEDEKINIKFYEKDIDSFVNENNINGLEKFYKFSSFYIYENGYKGDKSNCKIKYACILNSDPNTLYILNGRPEWPLKNDFDLCVVSGGKNLKNEAQFDNNVVINRKFNNFYDCFIFSNQKDSCVDLVDPKFSRIRIFDFSLSVKELFKYDSSNKGGSIHPCAKTYLERSFSQIKSYYALPKFDRPDYLRKGSIIQIVDSKNLGKVLWIYDGQSLITAAPSESMLDKDPLYEDQYFQFWCFKHLLFLKNKIFVEELEKYNIFTEKFKYLNCALSCKDRFQNIFFYSDSDKDAYLEKIKNIYGSTKNRGYELYFNNIDDANLFIKSKSLSKVLKASNLIFYNKELKTWELENLIIFEDENIFNNPILVIKNNNSDTLLKNKDYLKLMTNQLNSKNFIKSRKEEYLVFHNYNFKNTFNDLFKIDPNNTLLNYNKQFGVFSANNLNDVSKELYSLLTPLYGKGFDKEIEVVPSIKEVLFDLIPNFHYNFTLDNFFNFKYFIIKITSEKNPILLRIIITNEKVYILNSDVEVTNKIISHIMFLNSQPISWVQSKKISSCLIQYRFYNDLAESCKKDFLQQINNFTFYLDTRVFYTPSLQYSSLKDIFFEMLNNDSKYVDSDVLNYPIDLNSIIEYCPNNNYLISFSWENRNGEFAVLGEKLAAGKNDLFVLTSYESLFSYLKENNLTVSKQITFVSYDLTTWNDKSVPPNKLIETFIWLSNDQILYYEFSSDDKFSTETINKIDSFLKKNSNILSKNIQKQKFFIKNNNEF